MQRLKKAGVLLLCLFLMCVLGVMPAQAAAVRKVKLNKQKATVYVGKKIRLKASVTPKKAKGAKITWKSNRKKVAKVKNGVVTGVRPGTAKITAKTANGKKATCVVTVLKKINPKKVTLNQSSWKMNVGESYTLQAVISPSNATNVKLKWNSSNTQVAKVIDGKVTAYNPGTATITVKTANGKKASCIITVAKGGVVNVQSADDFMKSVSSMTKKAAEEGTVGMSMLSEGYSRRLIVKTSSSLDFSAYQPEQIVASVDGVYFIQFATYSATKNCFNSLANDSRVEFVEYDDYLAVDNTTNIAADLSKAYSNAKSWGVDAIGADDFAKFVSGKTSDSITVAVIDTGVADNHAFLSGRVVSGGYDLVDGDGIANDGNGHGTHVAGTVVDCTPGLNVKILPIRVLDDDGRGTNGNVANGVYYAVRKGAKIINLSLGGGTSSYLDLAIKYAVNQGVTVVCAAGNENGNTSSKSPAHLNEAIVVAACDDKWQRAHFSNYGTSVDLIAPGVEIISCIPGGNYGTKNGTSMASPHVAGLAAMVKLIYPSYTPSQVESFLEKYTTDLGSSGYDIYYGYGRPNMNKALDDLDIKPSISLTAGTISGDTVALSAKTVPANSGISWSSSNTAVARVSGGKVTAVAEGTATITATISYNGKNYSASKTVTVGKSGTYGPWSAWTRTAISPSATREVQYTPMYRYYVFYCSYCGARDPFWGTCSGCGRSLPAGTWNETWSATSYANCGSAVWPQASNKRYTYNLDGKIWFFGNGNLYSTAVGTKDSGSDAVVIEQGYRSRSISYTTHITSVY